jgi:hypothetical protein
MNNVATKTLPKITTLMMLGGGNPSRLQNISSYTVLNAAFGSREKDSGVKELSINFLHSMSIPTDEDVREALHGNSLRLPSVSCKVVLS